MTPIGHDVLDTPHARGMTTVVGAPSLRGALATKQSSYPLCRAMDCFASLAMTLMEFCSRLPRLTAHCAVTSRHQGRPLKSRPGRNVHAPELNQFPRAFARLPQLAVAHQR